MQGGALPIWAIGTHFYLKKGDWEGGVRTHNTRVLSSMLYRWATSPIEDWSTCLRFLWEEIMMWISHIISRQAVKEHEVVDLEGFQPSTSWFHPSALARLVRRGFEPPKSARRCWFPRPWDIGQAILSYRSKMFPLFNVCVVFPDVYIGAKRSQCAMNRFSDYLTGDVDELVHLGSTHYCAST